MLTAEVESIRADEERNEVKPEDECERAAMNGSTLVPRLPNELVSAVLWPFLLRKPSPLLLFRL